MAKAKTKKQPAAFDDATMIRDPYRWPCWPYLPVKRRNNDMADGNLGILMADEALVNDGRPVVYHVYLFDLPKTPEAFMAAKKTEYPTVEALLADGWVVD